MSTDSVIGFSSPPPTTPAAETMPEDVVNALRMDREMAENLFARLAKTQLALELKNLGVQAERVTEVKMPLERPLYVVSMAVLFNLSMSDEDIADLIHNLVCQLRDHVCNTLCRGFSKVTLVEAMTAEIKDASEHGDLRLTVKQKVC